MADDALVAPDGRGCACPRTADGSRSPREPRDDIVVVRGKRGETTSAADDVDVVLNASSSDVEVRCPVGTDVVVGSASGSVQLHGHLGAARVTTASGSIRVESVASADLRTHSARVEVDECLGPCRVMNTSGRVEIHRAGEVEVKCVSGSVEVSGDAVRVRTVSGKVRIDTNLHAWVETVSGKVEVWVPPGFHPRGAIPRSRPRGDRRAAGERRRDLRAHRQRIGAGAVAVTTTAEAPAPVVSGAVLFTDLVGFTEFTASQGDEGAVELLGRQEQIVEAVLPEGSRVVKELGDGLLLWFPDADSALSTALDLQEGFEEVAAETGLPLWVRMGLHWGQQTRRRDDLVGHDVNVAARIVDVAGPGEVLLSDATRVAPSGPAPTSASTSSVRW